MIDKVISLIKPLNEAAMEQCQLRLDNLTKPLHSLYSFEHLARRIAGITGNPRPRNLQKSIILMASDQGVSVTAGGGDSLETTAHRIENFCQGGAVINVFAAHVSAPVILVDIGVAVDLPSYGQVRYEKIAYGTKNIAQQAAMTKQQVVQAINVGITIARQEVATGARLIGLGEMSVDSSLPSTAVIACYSSKPLGELTDCAKVIATALAVNCPDKNDPLDVLRKVGGLDIAGLVGVILGAAALGSAVVLDGLITSAAALIAVKIAPAVQGYLIGSHYSVEPAHQEALAMLEIPAYLQLGMNLGEGTGAALGMSLITASLHVLNDMKTFSEAEVAVAQDGPGTLKQSKAMEV
jgi:nicotinate-nucleotide--dimethylbenzimidazole phosphoribosyltransferase